MKRLTKVLVLVTLLLLSSDANAAFDTVSYVSIDGSGSGTVEFDDSRVTLLDSDGGDMWNQGDNFIYLHGAEPVKGDFTATIRVIGQTEAIDGRWGKAGIRASNNLSGTSANAMVQIAAGNDSQPSGSNPVPARLAGRRTNGTLDGGFENPILDSAGAEVPNDVFRTDGAVNVSWLSLSYTEATNAFVAGIAPDVGGAPGEWSYSAPNTDVQTSGEGWYLGLAYSAHSDMNFTQITRDDGFHGVTFECMYRSFCIPEPSSIALLGLGVLCLGGLRR